MKKFVKMIKNEKHFPTVLQGFSEAFVTGRFCDVKVVCKDTNLWAHRLVLCSVSPFLRALLVDFERRGDDVITIFLPLIKGYHMKLVLDYIYSGAMYLCGAHMQYVIQVMEVLQLKCGVSVNKMVKASEESLDPEKQWIEIEHSTMHLKEYDSDPELNKVEDELQARLEKENLFESQNFKSGKKNASTDKAAVNIEDNLERVSEMSKCANIAKDSINGGESMKPSVELSNSVKNNTNSAKSTFTKDFDCDSDDDNDVVMVELDEDFVVERVEEQQHNMEDNSAELVGEHNTPSHRCVLCGRTFTHYDNLQVHLTGHLGVKVNINRCNTCQKNFKNKNELDLHMRSHKFAKMLGKFKINKSKKTNTVIKKIISTAGSKDKKIVRKYMKERDQNIVTKAAVVKAVRTPKRAENGFNCEICDKSFSVKSIYVRHVKKFHPTEAETLLQNLPPVKKKTSSMPKSPRKNLGPSTPKSKRTPISPKKFQDSFEKYENVPFTPNRFSPAASSDQPVENPSVTNVTKVKKTPKVGTPKTAKTPKTPKTPKVKTADYYSTLECPDCDRVFIAKSIFERHLQSAKHGQYNLYSSPASDGYPQWPGGYSSPLTPQPSSSWGDLGIPTVTVTSSPETASPGSPKIECHLCGQTFVRVKDLAKHREKVCSAYHNMAKN